MRRNGPAAVDTALNVALADPASDLGDETWSFGSPVLEVHRFEA